MAKEKKKRRTPSVEKLNALWFHAQGYVYADVVGRLQAKAAELEAEIETYKGILKAGLQGLLDAEVEATVAGEEYTATLVPTTVTEVDLEVFRKACPPKLFREVIKVEVEVGKARKFCSEALAKASTERPGTPRLVVERKNGKEAA